MYLLYSFTLTVLFALLLPYFLYQALRHGKYASSFRERLGRLPATLGQDPRPTVWVHAVSVGEFLAAKPLIAALREEFTDWRIVVSTTTATGQRLARAEQPDRFDAVCYFPFDWAFSVRRALDRIRPSLVVILETELWPNFLRECRRRGVVTVVANGRISPRSFARYRRARGFIRRTMADLSLLVMQSEADAERARALGAREVRVCGNLKYDAPLGGTTSPLNDPQSPVAGELDRRLALSSARRLIVAGSTAPGEERMLLAALCEIRREPGLEETRLLIAPRHPERFDEVAEQIGQYDFRTARRSALPAGAAEGEAARAEVILLDSIGELAALYRFAAVVFVGGSLVPRGGHNIIEPAAFARPIVVGPHTENFKQIVADFAEAGAVVQVVASGDGMTGALARALCRLLKDREAAQAMGVRARQILLSNRGATHCTVLAIRERMR
ncbi:MAG TPA: 3-deoxy-D-manno-octulosonic acid transferase [Blastocatellia bacterium]|nr:3-deoxy-D-manno-octulosonic acid transferase [Blastocatellia bacterium]